MRIRLLKMEIRNFQGCKHLVLEPNGKNLNIYGQNETGKTTIASAHTWLWFDKNVHNQSTQKFDIKPLDGNNEPIHGLETSVKETLDIDGKQLTIEKKYYEVWEKKRGSSQQEFTGHTTDHYISGVPVKKSEFDTTIKELADEKIFRLLTDPLFFNTQLHWKERRDILEQVCGGISDKEVIEANDDLQELADVLAERDVDKQKAVLKSQMDDIDEELDAIRIRIDENYRNLPDISGINPDELQADIQALKDQKKEKEQELARIESGGEIAQKEKLLAEIETELQKIRNEHSEKYQEDIAEAKDIISKTKDKIAEIERGIRLKKQESNDADNRIAQLDIKRQKLREEWYAINASEISAENTCPTCGQPLPEDQVEEAVKKANLAQAEKLKEISAEGKGITAVMEELLEKINGLDDEIHTLEDEYSKLQDIEKDYAAELERLKEKAEQYHESFEYQKKLEEKRDLEQSIQKLRADNTEAIADIKNYINNLELQISTLEKEFKKLDDYKKGQKRIEELKAEEEDLSGKYEELERQMYLCEQFEKTRAELLESKVNGMFKMATFKLFEKQINGGINPTCRTLYKGVPYNTNLNDGHKVKVGIDIINTLSRHYNFWAPIFVDGMESVTGDIEAESQLIKLIVSEKDKKLRVEHEEKKMKEAV